MSSHRSRSKTISRYLTSALESKPNPIHQTKSPLLKADPNWFDEVFRCYICLQNLSSPTLCPKCSKLCCDPCIKKWLRERKEECPHCRAHIDQTDLVPCRFLDDIQEQIKLISASASDQVDLCPEHKTRMTYYCHTCQIPICSDCGMFGDAHKDHKFEKLEKIYEQRIDGLQSYLVTLRKRMAKFTKKIKEIERKVQNCNLAKVEADRELVYIVSRYRTNLDLQLREKHAILFSQRSTLVKQGEFLMGTMAKLDEILANKSQVEVLQSDEKVLDLLKQVEQVILHNPGDEASVDMTFEKDFLPSYDLYLFRIPDFKTFAQDAGTFESSTVSQGGLVWQLKASIENADEKNGGYLALFINLNEGEPVSSRYYIRVELKHPTRPEAIIREFCFDMKLGDTRGFRQFCRIQTILSKGYLNHTTGRLELICGVRPLSYRQRCRDQRRYIQELETRLSQLEPGSSQIPENSGELVSPYEILPTIISPSALEASTSTPGNREFSGAMTEDGYGELIGTAEAMLAPSLAPVGPRVFNEPRFREAAIAKSHRNVGNSRIRSASLSNNERRPVSLFEPERHQLPTTEFIYPESSLPGTSSRASLVNQSQYLRRPAKNAVSRIEPRGVLISPHQSSPRIHQRTESHQENPQLLRQTYRNRRQKQEFSSDSEYDEMEHCTAIPSFTNTEELRQLIHQEFDSWSGNLSALGTVPRSTRAPPSEIRLPPPRLATTLATSPSNSSSEVSSSCPTPRQSDTISDPVQDVPTEVPSQNQTVSSINSTEALIEPQISVSDPSSSVVTPSANDAAAPTTESVVTPTTESTVAPSAEPIVSPPLESTSVPSASPTPSTNDLPIPRIRHRSHSSATCCMYPPTKNVDPAPPQP